MAQAKVGDKVKVHFTGSLEDGTIFGSALEDDPFEFTIGEKNMLPGFENAVVGMTEGEKKTISLPPEEAYGHHKREFVFAVKKSEMPPDTGLEEGRRIQIRWRDGGQAVVTVGKITEDTVILDANDPLAGKTIKFDIELVKIL
ncbi:MAG: FKBP-type peptidyl-prolyl cis-trans isomerase [Deltaproteobacteria bacterium]|nr:MAG: FKBP-type peptidyl-prolyl cis-trans isomerase [Deltaproteobacteria bacterium]